MATDLEKIIAQHQNITIAQAREYLLELELSAWREMASRRVRELKAEERE